MLVTPISAHYQKGPGLYTTLKNKTKSSTLGIHRLRLMRYRLSTANLVQYIVHSHGAKFTALWLRVKGLLTLFLSLESCPALLATVKCDIFNYRQCDISYKISCCTVPNKAREYSKGTEIKKKGWTPLIHHRY